MGIQKWSRLTFFVTFFVTFFEGVRLWIPQLPKKMTEHWIDNIDLDTHKLCVQLCCIVYWLDNIYEDNDFVEKFKASLLKYPNVDIAAMGFQKNWKEEPLWRL